MPWGRKQEPESNEQQTIARAPIVASLRTQIVGMTPSLELQRLNQASDIFAQLQDTHRAPSSAMLDTIADQILAQPSVLHAPLVTQSALQIRLLSPQSGLTAAEGYLVPATPVGSRRKRRQLEEETLLDSVFHRTSIQERENGVQQMIRDIYYTVLSANAVERFADATVLSADARNEIYTDERRPYSYNNEVRGKLAPDQLDLVWRLLQNMRDIAQAKVLIPGDGQAAAALRVRELENSMQQLSQLFPTFVYGESVQQVLDAVQGVAGRAIGETVVTDQMKADMQDDIERIVDIDADMQGRDEDEEALTAAYEQLRGQVFDATGGFNFPGALSFLRNFSGNTEESPLLRAALERIVDTHDRKEEVQALIYTKTLWNRMYQLRLLNGSFGELLRLGNYGESLDGIEQLLGEYAQNLHLKERYQRALGQLVDIASPNLGVTHPRFWRVVDLVNTAQGYDTTRLAESLDEKQARVLDGLSDILQTPLMQRLGMSQQLIHFADRLGGESTARSFFWSKAVGRREIPIVVNLNLPERHIFRFATQLLTDRALSEIINAAMDKGDLVQFAGRGWVSDSARSAELRIVDRQARLLIRENEIAGVLPRVRTGNINDPDLPNLPRLLAAQELAEVLDMTETLFSMGVQIQMAREAERLFAQARGQGEAMDVTEDMILTRLEQVNIEMLNHALQKAGDALLEKAGLPIEGGNMNPVAVLSPRMTDSLDPLPFFIEDAKEQKAAQQIATDENGLTVLEQVFQRRFGEIWINNTEAQKAFYWVLLHLMEERNLFHDQVRLEELVDDIQNRDASFRKWGLLPE